MQHGQAHDLGIPGIEGGERVGEGGNAIVYRCRQPALDRLVAVKVLKGATDEGTQRRFDRERKAMGRLSQHDGIVTVYDTGFLPTGEPYLTMPLLSASLDDEITHRRRLSWRDAVQTMATVCDTVAYAHAQGVVHRDLKPGNIMRGQSGRPLVSDFGISRIVDAETSLKSTALTLTPAYSPPEALDGAEAAPKADIYALGATLYALLEGHPPFMDPGGDISLLALVRRIVDDPVGPFSDDVPDNVREVVRTAMAKSPRDRFASASAFTQALESTLGLGGEAPRTLPTDGIGTTPPPAEPVPAPPTPTAAQPPTLTPATTGEPPPKSVSVVSSRLFVSIAAIAAVVLIGTVAAVVALRPDDDDTNSATSTQNQQSAVEPDQAELGEASNPAPAGTDVAEPDVSTTAPATTASTSGIPTTVAAPTTSTLEAGSDASPAQVESSPGEVIGPAELGGNVSQLVVADDEVWFIAPRSPDTTGRVDPASLDEVESYDFEFFPIQIAVDTDHVYGTSIDGGIERLSRNGGAPATLALEEQARLMTVDGDWLWAVTADSNGSSTQLHRIDKVDLVIDGSVNLPDFVFNLVASPTHVWVAVGGRTLITIDRSTLAVGPELSTPFTTIDDLDVIGDTLFATGGVFDLELSSDSLAHAAVSGYDSTTGALRFHTTIDEPVSIFEDVEVAAGASGAWVTNQTSRLATLVDAEGAVRRSVTTLRNVNDAALAGDDLLLLSGSSAGGELFRLPI